MRKIIIAVLVFFIVVCNSNSQNATYHQINFVKSDGSSNSDATYFYRDDQIVDRSSIKLRMGDENSSDFQIGYTFYKDGQWYKTFSLDGNGNGFFKGKLEVSTDLYINNGWLRVKGKNGLYFQDYGGGFYMTNDSWIRTYGSKNFYHNSGIMRTDGTFQVGSNGDRFVVNSTGQVGIGTTTPNNSYKLDVNGKVVSSDVLIRKTGTISKIIFSAQTNDPGEIRHIENNNSAQLWIDPSDDFDVGVTNDYFIVGEPDTNTKRFWVRGDGAAYVNKNLGIGKVAEGNNKLDVAGTIRADEIKVEDIAALNMNLSGDIAANNITIKANGQTADFVFEPDYQLKDLSEVETFIKTNKHLPDIPRASEMEIKG